MKNIIQIIKGWWDYLTHKEIELTVQEVTWIKLFKHHYSHKIKYTGNWIETMKPLFKEIYAWCPDDDGNNDDYLNCIFNKLLDIHLKIHENGGYRYKNLNDIFHASFYKSFRCQGIESPIERSILALISEIGMTRVVLPNGKRRFNLDNDIYNR